MLGVERHIPHQQPDRCPGQRGAGIGQPVAVEAASGVLDDQQRAGALMWTAVTIIYVVAGVIVATRSLSRSSLRVDERSTLPVACDLRTGLVP